MPSHPSSPLFTAFHPDNLCPMHLSISALLTETSATLKVSSSGYSSTTCSSCAGPNPCRGLFLVFFVVGWHCSRQSREWLTPRRSEARCTPKITTSLSVSCHRLSRVGRPLDNLCFLLNDWLIDLSDHRVSQLIHNNYISFKSSGQNNPKRIIQTPGCVLRIEHSLCLSVGRSLRL